MPKFAILNATFLTMDENNLIIKGSLLVKDGIIEKVAEDIDPKDLTDYQLISGEGKLYMPGLINTHGHTPMSLLRGYSDDTSLNKWFEKIWPIEDKLTSNDVKWGSLLSIAEMLKGGTTCFVDMYDHMDEVAKNVELSGIRAVLARGVIGLCSPDALETKLTEARNFSKEWHQKANGRITTMIAPHAPYTCPPKVLSKMVDMAHDLNLPIHTHLSETSYEVEEMQKQYNLSPIDYLEKYEVFSCRCLAAHAVYVSDEEIEKLAKYQVKVSHNIGSNLKLGNGIAPINKMLAHGIIVSLGTDGAASNNNLDLFEEMRLATLAQKGITKNPEIISKYQALKMATVNGADSVWINNIGTLKAGMKADFIAIDINQPHLLPSENIISHLVYSASARDVLDVWIDGREIVRNREILTFDEEQVKFEFTKCYKNLIN